jgi:uncharacterized protein YndB with AHSA1/START domain
VYREVVPKRKLVFTWNLHDGSREGWRGAFKRLAQLLQQTH